MALNINGNGYCADGLKCESQYAGAEIGVCKLPGENYTILSIYY